MVIGTEKAYGIYWYEDTIFIYTDSAHFSKKNFLKDVRSMEPLERENPGLLECQNNQMFSLRKIWTKGITRPCL
jgi:hypothetical protein